MNKVDLSTFNNSWYNPGGGIKRFVWYFVNELIIKNTLLPFSSLKIFFLKIFGAKLGNDIVIKPGVNIKYPWNLTVGNNVWIGEDVWIDNLDECKIGNNVCISQGAMLLSGNHNFKKSTFDLMVGKIELEEGVWLGAKSLVTGGVKCSSHSILAVSSTTSKDLKSYTIYRGNPAVEISTRVIE